MNKLFSGLTNRLLLVLVISCTPLFAACGGNRNGESVVGTVTVNGQPVESGAITFMPVNGQSAIAGAKIKDGKYEVVVAAGKSKVEIRVPVVVGQTKLYDTPDSPVMDVTEESLPDKYHDKTELEMDVVAGTNTKDWELSKQK